MPVGLRDSAEFNANLRSAAKRSPAQHSYLESELIRDEAARAYYTRLGSGLAEKTRSRILGASPELGRVANFLEDAYVNPIPNALRGAYQDYIRGAQSARGFGGGGTGETSEEARYLLGVAEQRRMELLPFQMQFGQQLLGMAGFGGAQSPTGQEVFGIHAQRKALSIQNQQRRDSRNQGYISAAGALLGGVGGLASGLAGAYGNYQQGQAYASAGQYLQSQMGGGGPANLQGGALGGGLFQTGYGGGGGNYIINNPQPLIERYQYSPASTGPVGAAPMGAPKQQNTGSLFYAPNVIKGDIAPRTQRY